MVPVSAASAWSLVFGCLLGLGLWSIFAAVPRFGRPRLADRVAPALVDVSEEARAHLRRRTADPLPVIGALALPVLTGGRALLSWLFGGAETAALRLRQAGSSLSVDRFRAEQVVWALVGFAAAVAVVAIAAPARTLPAVAQLALPVIAALLGAALRDLVARNAAQRRLARITEELPTVLEFLTLSLSAGESILDAVRRVARTGSGELAAEFGGVVARVGTGVPVATTLDELASALRLPALSRAVDQITAALERGTPLSGVLRAQAGDARSDAKNRLLETAGRKEVAMLVPLVFLILPITVVIAIFPGLFVLQAGF
ncbi:type II secretion system F family protein [Rathayibacter sp. YIM 133350]|uniref:type II secretion system F family protein n=1 Tax=Rathayibacter sp. YIM 133350 TaxID=3131992 RepID=UPI00307F0BDF